MKPGSGDAVHGIEGANIAYRCFQSLCSYVFSFFGTGPITHHFYRLLSTIIKPTSDTSKLRKLLVERLIFAPSFLLLFFYAIPIIQVCSILTCEVLDCPDSLSWSLVRPTRTDCQGRLPGQSSKVQPSFIESGVIFPFIKREQLIHTSCISFYIILYQFTDRFWLCGLLWPRDPDHGYCTLP